MDTENLQGHFGDARYPEWRNDGPLDVADDVRVAYRKAQEKAELDESFSEFQRHGRSVGATDSAQDLERLNQWNDLAREHPAAAAMHLRQHYLTVPPGRKAAEEPKPEPKAAGYDSSYDDVMAAVEQARGIEAERDTRKRADGALKGMSDRYGSEAADMIRAAIGIDKHMRADPIGNAPRLMRSLVDANHTSGEMASAHSEVDEFSKSHPEMSDREIRQRMSAELQKMPSNTADPLAKALAAAKGVRYRNDADRQADIENDIRGIPQVDSALKISAARRKVSRDKDW